MVQGPHNNGASGTELKYKMIIPQFKLNKEVESIRKCESSKKKKNVKDYFNKSRQNRLHLAVSVTRESYIQLGVGKKSE